ncbi:ParB N-terminal domain-containing protein [Nocardioides sp.]|uniref:ParB N-terminal domain-containing protein n=1 Tax=Nocardioides sp. TaxID=35761 RepID=UPI002B5F1309|nr:ParB N-terminal domain-containing protein [Nocardioides sp.]HXH78425.1 ParB N-terminal domain-containing protein [Nocardioides sp.]
MAPVAKPIASKRISVDKLRLDPQNPRLIMENGADEEALLAKLYAEESLDELVPSFLENGYFEEEPLVVVGSGTTYIVVEGNRRLATLKLLLNPVLRKPARVSGWPTLTDEQRAALNEVPCVVYERREHVLPFLGFRHITGAKKWRPFQKARFVAQLLDSGQTLDHVQEVIGDDASATKKLYQDFVVYNQLVEQLDFPAERVRDRFSLLEVMLGQRPIKTHLAMSMRLPNSKVDAIIPDNKLDELAEVTGWVFGTADKLPVINDSREIGRLLAPVIKDPEALEYLRRTGDLEAAYERSGGEEEFLLKKLTRVEKLVQEIAGVLPLHAEDPAIVDGVRRISKLTASLVRQLPSE